MSSAWFTHHLEALLTDGANNAGSAIHLWRSIVNIQAGVPLHLGAVVQVVESVTHFDDVFSGCSEVERKQV